jgi:hypothetical protein
VRPGSAGWWTGKVRQARRFIGAQVGSAEHDAAKSWLTAAQLALFDSMHVADRRHGLDVVTSLRRDGTDDDDLLLAGLLHDAGKGDTGLFPRVIYSLSQAYGGWIASAFGWLPAMGSSLERLRTHAETSAVLAGEAGCSPRTVELIRWQESPRDPEAGERLRLADEAN